MKILIQLSDAVMFAYLFSGMTLSFTLFVRVFALVMLKLVAFVFLLHYTFGFSLLLGLPGLAFTVLLPFCC